MNEVVFTIFLRVIAVGTNAPASQPSEIDWFFHFYATNLRASLFAGFLTLGSFLVAVNTFIVVNLKKEVYEHKLYKKRVQDARRSDPKASFFGPLRRLSELLFAAILLALVTAISQLTVGVLIPHWGSALFCLCLAGITVVLLLFVLWQIRQNLNDLFVFLEAAADADYHREDANKE